MEINITNQIFDKAPEFERIVLVCKGIDNTKNSFDLTKLLQVEQEKVFANQALDNYKEYPNILSWRNTLKIFNVNPNANPPSIMQLIKRIKKGGKLPYINTLVTIFNIISIRHILPLGGDDLAVFDNNAVLTLGLSSGEETYTPLGKTNKKEVVKPNEPTYFEPKSGKVLCRYWCVRNSDITKITPTTNTVAINIDRLPPISNLDHRNIAQELEDLIKKYCGGEVIVFILNKDNPSCVL